MVMKKILLLSIILIIASCKNVPGTQSAKDGMLATDKKEQKQGSKGGFNSMAEKAANEAYKGVFTSDGKQEGLFPLKSTGVSIQPIVEAANFFIKGLSPEEKKKVIFKVDDKEWRHWANVDNGIFQRAGIALKEMNQKQRVRAFNLLQEALSVKGLQLSRDIMKTDQTLRELNNDDPIYDEDLYFLTIMGTPSTTTPWGFQFEGHHLVINYFVLGDQVVMTPTFMGGEPIITTTGKYKGNTLFQDEQNLGLEFMQSLSSEQQIKASLSNRKNRNDIEAEAFSDNATVDFEGLQATEMTADQKEALLHLAAQYIYNMKEGHAKVKMEEIKNHLEKTYFAWRGAITEDAVFYYRIHSPVVLIEFDHQGPIGIKGENGRAPTRNHIHTIVRTPNGNDYGKDYLKQHLEEHHHH